MRTRALVVQHKGCHGICASNQQDYAAAYVRARTGPARLLAARYRQIPLCARQRMNSTTRLSRKLMQWSWHAHTSPRGSAQRMPWNLCLQSTRLCSFMQLQHIQDVHIYAYMHMCTLPRFEDVHETETQTNSSARPTVFESAEHAHAHTLKIIPNSNSP